MPRDNRPPQRLCGKCSGRGTVKTPRARRSGGKTVTEMVDEPCTGCGGVGWVNR